MLYAGEADGFRKIGLARSENGLTWIADDEPVLLPGETWDALSVQPGSVVESRDGWTLWYTGSNGSQERIGQAVSTDGVAWVKEDDAVVTEGSPGAFDDSSVADPGCSGKTALCIFGIPATMAIGGALATHGRTTTVRPGCRQLGLSVRSPGLC